MRKIKHFKEIVDHNLEQIDLTPEQKQQVREQVKSSPQPSPAKKKHWWATVAFPAIAAALVCAVAIPIAYQQPNSSNLLVMDNLMENITPNPPRAQPDSTENPVNLPDSSPQGQENRRGTQAVRGEESQPAMASNELDTSSSVPPPFVVATADFSLELFRQSRDSSQNFLLSPASAALALGMTSNGSGGSTQQQFLTLLGDGLTQQALNQSYYQWINRLSTDQEGAILNLAGSIWFRKDGFTVNRDFLQTNADYFGADAYQLDFNQPSTIDKINQWVQDNTNGKIEEMVEEISPDTMMYLINTLYFEMNWQTPFPSYATHKKEFHTADSQTVSTDFMYEEHSPYFADDKAEGIKKQYADSKYSFVAIRPKNGVSLDDYLDSLTGEQFLSLIQQESTESASFWLPKFRYDSSVLLKEPLKNMGLSDAFSLKTADFSKISSTPLYLSQVLQKTFIEVDEVGTKAGAATLVEIKTESAFFIDHELIFDSPFLFAIIENETGLPLFLGTVMNPQA
ncbi:MAG: serine protease [Clostridiales bacterium]|jgi:serine protease inhibitor|nr:serine protease [Clostridiales bacterium]